MRIVVLIICLIICALFAVTLFIDIVAQRYRILLPDWFSIGNVDDARVILSTIIEAVSTVLGLVFSVVLLVLSMAASQFGPRLLRRFILTYNGEMTIGLFAGTFLFSLMTLVVVHMKNGHEFVPQLTIITSCILIILSFAALICFSQRIRTGIQTGNLVSKLYQDLLKGVNDYVALRKVHALENAKFAGGDSAALREKCVTEGYPILARAHGYLQAIDHVSIIKAATRADTTILLMLHPGEFVIAGTILAYVIPTDKGGLFSSVINEAFTVGANRTLTQDPDFAFAQIIEIGIRALSPAINDTFTGIACVDWLSDMIMSLVELPETGDSWFDNNGHIRLIVIPMKFPRLVRSAFDMIREAGATNPAVLIRLLHNFARIAPHLKSHDQRAAFMRQITAINDHAESNEFTSVDLEDIKRFHHHVCKALNSIDSKPLI